ncbi:hypothetical protein ACP70R_033615 [Stipagrostis hirtigluma subsp. patula]
MEAMAVMESDRLTAELAFTETATEPSFVVKIHRRLPDFARSVNLKYVRLGMRSGGLPALSSCVPLARLGLSGVRAAGVVRLHSLDMLTCVAWLGTATLLLTVYCLKRPWPVYLVEFLEMTESTGFFNAEARPPRLSMAQARAETADVMFGCLDALFAATGVDPPRYVRVLIVNCSLLNQTPSLESMVVHRMGGATTLLYNRRVDAGHAKYRLLHTVRTDKGAADECFGCVYQREDGGGRVGVSPATRSRRTARDVHEDGRLGGAGDGAYWWRQHDDVVVLIFSSRRRRRQELRGRGCSAGDEGISEEKASTVATCCWSSEHRAYHQRLSEQRQGFRF